MRESGFQPFILLGEGLQWCFHGTMDEVRIWNVVRTQEQIQDHMHCELAGNESGLIGYWKFNEASGSIAYDSSPFGNHAYPCGGATLVPSSAPSGGPIVRITRMSQRPFSSKLVDVRFNLSNCTGSNASASISLVASSDGGRTWNVPIVHLQGNVGPNILPGSGLTIIWNTGLDWPEMR